MSDPAAPNPITPISVEDLDRIGIDAANNLYWDGKRVETRQRLALSWWQTLGAFLVSFGALIGGVGAAVTGLKDGAEMLCQRGHPWFCASSAPAREETAPPGVQPIGGEYAFGAPANPPAAPAKP